MSDFESNTLTKWKSWLPIIHQDLMDIVIAKHVFWSVNDLLKDSEAIQKPSYYYQYLGSTYAIYALMGVRRQVKKSKDSISMLRLLEEIFQSPHILSREFYTAMYKGTPVEDLGDRHFDKICASTGDYISKEMVAKDIADLKAVVKTCEEFVDKKVAHLDMNPPPAPPKFNELDEAVDFLDQLFCKYNLIFTAGYTGSVLPEFQYDWQVIFDFPWRK